MIQTVARERDVHGAADEWDPLSADRQVQSRAAFEQQPRRGKALGQRLYPDAHRRLARVGKAERAWPDVHHHLPLEEGRVLDLRLAQHPPHLRAGDLPAAALVRVRRGLPGVEELLDVAGVETTIADHRIPALEPPAELGIEVRRTGLCAPEKSHERALRYAHVPGQT